MLNLVDDFNSILVIAYEKISDLVDMRRKCLGIEKNGYYKKEHKSHSWYNETLQYTFIQISRRKGKMEGVDSKYKDIMAANFTKRTNHQNTHLKVLRTLKFIYRF